MNAFFDRPFRLLFSLMLPALLACGPRAVSVAPESSPFEKEAVVRISGDGANVQSTSDRPCDPEKESCVVVERSGDYCTKDSNGPVDLIVSQGKVIATICYPEKAGPGGERLVEGAWDGSVKKSGAVVTFSPATDGQKQKGGLDVDGNQNTIYGNGPGKTIIEGDSHLNGNNNRVRGVTIEGDLRFNGNNVSLVFASISGNVSIEGNNAVLAEVVIFGDLKISGNNHKLTRVFVAGKTELAGKNYVCQTTHYFEDADQDGLFVPESETGKAWTCP